MNATVTGAVVPPSGGGVSSSSRKRVPYGSSLTKRTGVAAGSIRGLLTSWSTVDIGIGSQTRTDFAPAGTSLTRTS